VAFGPAATPAWIIGGHGGAFARVGATLLKLTPQSEHEIAVASATGVRHTEHTKPEAIAHLYCISDRREWSRANATPARCEIGPTSTGSWVDGGSLSAGEVDELLNSLEPVVAELILFG
jgi:hypothetical protein